ncbi:MAG: MarR family winged helix-turn-helix transcriptional regulator [Rhizobiaceae bacterium]
MADDLLDLESFLPYRLNRLAEAISREFARIFRDRHGLTRPEWRTLATLGQFGRMTATAVGAHSAMHKTKVSRAVADLERRRWLTRTPDMRDRRVEHLELTKAGRAVYRDMAPLAKAYQEGLLGRMTDDERAALDTALGALEDAARNPKSATAAP